ncbi:MAG TPA: ABC transporter permease [Candidatus Acidoferrum sp.]|nr:ABC transporter permease [Candidatus Acidoferrum sp.]
MSKKKREDELNKEIQHHLRMAEEQRVERGATEGDARAGARREFGNVGLVKEVTRDQWGWAWLGDMWNDLRFGARMLAKSPGFTIIAVLTLALGIGGNAMVLSWIRGVLLDPLPGVQDASRMAAIETVMPDGEYHTSSYPDWKDFREKNRSFSDIVGFEFIGPDIRLTAKSQIERVWGLIVTENYFDVLGVNPQIGRLFHEEANQGLGSDPDIVLSDGFWRQRFGANPKVIGQAIHLDGHPFTIVGVAPAEFHGTIVGVDPQYFVPMLMQPQALPGESLTERNPTFVHILGRLKPGVTIEQAQAELSTIAANLAKEYADTSRNVGVYVAPVWKAHYGVQDFLRSVFGFLMIAAVFVLLIACVNVANLLLARGSAREEELAVRTALGAPRNRLVRQLLMESLLLAAIGGVCGLLIASWGAKLLAIFLPPLHLPIALSVGINSTVLLATMAVTLLTGFLFGLMPALRASRVDLNACLKEGGGRARMGGSSHRLHGLLVISEMVLATVLLVVAGLLVRSVHNAEQAGPGFHTQNIALGAFDLRASGYNGQQASQFFDRLAQNLRSASGVEEATTERYVPLWFTGRSYTLIEVEHYTPRQNEDMRIDLNVVGANYFRTLDIPIVSGRDFSEQDRDGAPFVLIVNQTMAKHYWPGQDATGRQLRFWGHTWTVAGVARDVKYHRMNEPPEDFMYLPQMQAGGMDVNVLVRSQMPAQAVIGQIRAASRALDPNVQPLESDDLSGLLHASLFANRTAAGVATVLGGLGLLLAALGIYGVLSYSVSQRLREIGIRIAMGAQTQDILQLIGKRGLGLAAAGAAMGAIVSLGLAKAISSLLYGVTIVDPITFATVGALLTLVSLAACWVPTRKATRVDPIVALRYE